MNNDQATNAAAKTKVMARLAELRQLYIGHLPSRLQEIQDSWSAHCRGQAGQLREALRATHKLAGNAAVFGMGHLGHKAATLESLLERALEGTHVGDAEIAEAMTDIKGLIRP